MGPCSVFYIFLELYQVDGFGSWAIYWIYLNVSLGLLLFLCFNSYAMAKMKNIQQSVLNKCSNFGFGKH